MRLAWPVPSMGKRRVAYRILVGNPRGKRPLGRPRLRWRIILKLIFKKWHLEGGTDWIHLAQDRGR